MFPNYAKSHEYAFQNDSPVKIDFNGFLVTHLHDLRTYALLWVSYDGSKWYEVPGIHWGDGSYIASFCIYIQANTYVKCHCHCVGSDNWTLRVFELM